MRFIGEIEQLQVQKGSLKQGQRPNRYYDPAPLQIVSALRLTPAGAIGLLNGQEIVDVHNTAHSQSRNMGDNSLSLNFTAHYQHMAQRFGPHLQWGRAGENILVNSQQIWSPADFKQGLYILTQDGQEIAFDAVRAAAPCVEFSHYALAWDRPVPAGTLQETLQFLGNGTRGFYGQCEEKGGVIRPGDKLYIP